MPMQDRKIESFIVGKMAWGSKKYTSYKYFYPFLACWVYKVTQNVGKSKKMRHFEVSESVWELSRVEVQIAPAVMIRIGMRNLKYFSYYC
jgi:hypothetical protein